MAIDPLLLQNLGLGLMQYSSPGPRQNFGTTMLGALDRYGRQRQMNLENKRREEEDRQRREAHEAQMAKILQDQKDRQRLQSYIAQNQGGRGLGEVRPQTQPPYPINEGQVIGDAFMPGQAYQENLPRNEPAMRQGITDLAMQGNPHAAGALSLLDKYKAKTPEDFTLKPGDARYSGTGELIAQRDPSTDVQTAMSSAKTEILPDGTTIMALNDGSTLVKDAMGKTLTGQARVDAIQKAQDYGVTLQQERAQGRRAGTVTADTVGKLFTQTDGLRANNSNLKQLITEVKAGANSGPLINRLPTLTSASMRLESIKNRLGLDVISSVTFGALSSEELKLALRTAVPDLPNDKLVNWAQDKIDAQEKLISYLEQQASFLSKPGNTMADWIEMANNKKKENPTTSTFTSPGGIKFEVSN